MVSIALHTVLAAGREDDYEEVHGSIPREVAEALRAHGVRDWRIWRDGRDVFHLVDVATDADYERMRRALRDLPANRRWQATVGPMFEVADGYDGDDPRIALLWSLGGQLGADGGVTSDVWG
ncbi:hypothetical protein NOK12_22510 [Nocardioides sp. OK12]|uniref:L-rhamnose mutarotase n=1 Tax=Nocardioides sp. OK12 TaxID=2758661 RepID=UPI0021C2C529|nr:L-rhamnose mutarotase [Nocardioides sp. OK12]GHJ59733.1 hypothetical protein NOK12_22510 [Nocardioides sp. OK12]